MRGACLKMGGDSMTVLFELFAVLLPWVAVGVAVPLLLLAVRLAVRLIETASNRRTCRRSRRYFSQYVQRGFY